MKKYLFGCFLAAVILVTCAGCQSRPETKEGDEFVKVQEETGTEAESLLS